MSFLAPLLAWLAHVLHRGPDATAELRRASVFAFLAAALNVFIVVTIVTRLFGPGFLSEPEGTLHGLCMRWNVLNGIRMILTATAAFWLFAAFRRLDRAHA
jgi:hypothetical protein